MQGYNVIVVFNPQLDKMLMCRRKKEPYKNLSNFVGGKIEKTKTVLMRLTENCLKKPQSRQTIFLLHILWISVIRWMIVM